MYTAMYIPFVGENELTSWDDEKRERNAREHAYDFPAVQEVFDGRFCVTREDRRKDYSETRYNMLVEYRDRIINVTFTLRGGKYRLISVRPASRKERIVYRDRQQATQG